MTWVDYQLSKTCGDGDPNFYALIMAAMRKADSVNARKLRTTWPDVWDELQARYNAPGGYLPGEREQMPRRLARPRRQMAQMAQASEQDETIAAPPEDDVREVGDEE